MTGKCGVIVHAGWQAAHQQLVVREQRGVAGVVVVAEGDEPEHGLQVSTAARSRLLLMKAAFQGTQGPCFTQAEQQGMHARS